MSQLQAAAEVVRLQSIRTESARQLFLAANAAQSDALEVLEGEEKLLMQAQERLLDVASREPGLLAQTA
jgi:replicative DNA helicase